MHTSTDRLQVVVVVVVPAMGGLSQASAPSAPPACVQGGEEGQQPVAYAADGGSSWEHVSDDFIGSTFLLNNPPTLDTSLESASDYVKGLLDLEGGDK